MFAKRLKELREKAGYSQYSFADAMGIAQSTVGGWESGKREPNFDMTKKIADFFGVSVDYLLGRDLPEEEKSQSLNNELDEYLEQLKNRSEMRMLFKLAKGATKKDVEQAVKIIEAEMEKKFSSLMTASNVKVGGVDFVADVMNNLDRSSEKNIFDRLAEYNEPLADEIRKRMFVFEDIVTMDDRSVQRFVRDCDPRDLVLALKGANSDVANKIFTNMSARMAQSIREDLEITSNVRIRDVEEAQQRIVGIIRDLEERSELIILKGGKDDIIA